MIPRNIDPQSSGQGGCATDLVAGLPTIWGFACLAGRALAGQCLPPESLSPEAQVILRAAQPRGILELRGQPDAFDSTERLIAVAVEQSEGRWLIFKEKSNPRKTLAYVEGFRQLCQAGWVLHQSQREFSLTHSGYDASTSLAEEFWEAEMEWAIPQEF